MLVREIRIDRKKIVDRLPGPGRKLRFLGGQELTDDELHTAAEIIAQIDAAKADGARVLLVAIHDCEGGSFAAGDAIYRALRGFAVWPRRVIVHVSGFAASTAAHLALAGDFVLMDEDARFYLHSALPTREGLGVGEDLVARGNALVRAVALGRSAIPPAAIDDALACQYDASDPSRAFKCKALHADPAVEWRWADAVADLEDARGLAEFLLGGDVFTPRRTMLLERGSAGEPTSRLPPFPLALELSLVASKIAAGELRTANYAQDASGNPTAGAKLDHLGTALKVAPENLQIGGTAIRDTWFGKVRTAAITGLYYVSGGSPAWTWDLSDPPQLTDWSVAYGATENRLYLTLPGWGTKGFTAMQLVGATPKSVGNPTNVDPRYFVSFYSSYVNAGNLTVVLEVRKTSITQDGLGGYTLESSVVDWRTLSSGVRFNLSFLAFTDNGWGW